MKINSVGNIGQNILKGVKEVGTQAISYKNTFKKFAKKEYDQFQNTNFGKNVVNNKETIIGAGIILVATTLAIKCIKGMVDKIKEVKNN